MVRIIYAKGANSYKTPHLKKDARARRGDLPTCLSCSQEAFSKAKIAVRRQKSAMADTVALNNLTLWEIKEWEKGLSNLQTPTPSTPEHSKVGASQFLQNMTTPGEDENEDIDERDCVN
jgi:hypothetical protein